MIKIQSQKITGANFSEFGKIVTTPAGIPTAEGDSFKFWSDIAHYHIEGETEIGYCTVFQQPGKAITMVERHRLTPEILIPIDAPFVLPLLRDLDDDSKMCAFTVDIGQAVVINEDIWHGACLPIGKKESSYFVIFRRGTPQSDVEKRNVQEIFIEF